MARRRIVEGTWRCRSCDTQGIAGRHKTCPQCGNPREAGEAQFDFDGAAPAVTDPAVVALANAGKDWFCAACSASNRGDVAVCHQCGAERAEPPPPPPPPAARSLPVALPVAGLSAAAIAVLACCGGAGLLGYVNRPVEVQATVADRTWFREVTVERLVPTPAEGWRDALPPEARLPGSGGLSEGRGAVSGCETRKCWPRPPDGATFARVTGRAWSREIRTRRLVGQRREGWDEAVPAGRGAMPVGGAGGSEGVDGTPSCAEREREPERCRTVERQETCGTEERCTRRDLGNGFAEEVCEDVPKTCSRTEEECTPAVRDRWCTWTELAWQPGRQAKQAGTFEAPVWPSFAPAPDEQVARTESYSVALAPLAGPARGSVAVPHADAMVPWTPGDLVFARDGRIDAVPPALRPRDLDRVDCDDGVPFDVLATRDWCRYERWSWQGEPPLRAEAVGEAPAWPDGRLGPDGREARREWVVVRLVWRRGEHTGERALELRPGEWDRWPEGRTVPVRVDHRAGFLGFVESSTVP